MIKFTTPPLCNSERSLRLCTLQRRLIRRKRVRKTAGRIPARNVGLDTPFCNCHLVGKARIVGKKKKEILTMH